MNGPQPLAFDGTVNLYVANYGNTVTLYAPGKTHV
jgi:hypothetical protein